MPIALTDDELDVISRLEATGLSRVEATISVVLVTREHSRPEEELLHILRAYQGLDSDDVTRQAMMALKQAGWIVERQSYGLTLVEQVADLREKIASKCGAKTLARQLVRMRVDKADCFRLVGSMVDENSYTSYLERLRDAHSTICLPMLATTPDLAAIPILKARSQAGVRVRILLAEPDLVVALRGESQRRTSKDSIQGWRTQFRGYPNVEIRLAKSIEDTFLATCLLVDDSILRVDLYDPYRHRSLQGILFEFSSQDGIVWNLTRILQSVFDDAWERATPLKWTSRMLKRLKDSWQLVTAIVFTIAAIALFSLSGVLSGIVGSAAGSFFVNWAVDWRASIKTFFKKWRTS